MFRPGPNHRGYYHEMAMEWEDPCQEGGITALLTMFWMGHDGMEGFRLDTSFSSLDGLSTYAFFWRLGCFSSLGSSRVFFFFGGCFLIFFSFFLGLSLGLFLDFFFGLLLCFFSLFYSQIILRSIRTHLLSFLLRKVGDTSQGWDQFSGESQDVDKLKDFCIRGRFATCVPKRCPKNTCRESKQIHYIEFQSNLSRLSRLSC